MTEPSGNPQIKHFADFEFDPAAGELRKHGLKIKLQGQPIEILGMLLERPGQVVTREEIQKKLWAADTNVEFEHSVNVAVKRLRDALNDDADAPRYIETLPKRGYRFIATVDHATPAPSRRRPRWTLVAAVAAAAFVLLFALNVRGVRSRIFPVRRPIQSIAVLPLANLSGDPSQDYFVDGMTEALITELGKISALRVISRQSMMQYKETKKSVPQIAKELSVEAVVEGSVVRSGDRVRVSLQLIEPNPERHLWANSYDRELRDVLALHTEMARSLATEVRATLRPSARGALAQMRAVDPEAYAAYLRGRYYWNRIGGPADLDKALESFNLAIRKDPFYAAPHASAAFCLSRSSYSRSPSVFSRAREHALTAIKLDENLAEGHAALGEINFVADWDWAGAGREFKRALDLSPGSADAHWQYGIFLVRVMGRSEEGIAETHRAQSLDPLSILTNIALASNFLRSRRYDEAISRYRQALELDRNYRNAREWIAWCYALKAEYSKAFAEYKALGDFPDLELGHLAYLQAMSGDRRQALRTIAALKANSSRRYVDPFDVAIAYAGLGDKDSVFDWLGRAYEQHSPQLPALRAEPFLDTVHTDLRFQHLLRRMNFPPIIQESANRR